MSWITVRVRHKVKTAVPIKIETTGREGSTSNDGGIPLEWIDDGHPAGLIFLPSVDPFGVFVLYGHVRPSVHGWRRYFFSFPLVFSSSSSPLLDRQYTHPHAIRRHHNNNGREGIHPYRLGSRLYEIWQPPTPIADWEHARPGIAPLFSVCLSVLRLAGLHFADCLAGWLDGWLLDRYSSLLVLVFDPVLFRS